MEYRFATGAFLEPGPATVWMRMRQPLVAGEEPTPLQRVLTAADSGNGVSAALDWSRYLFINVDLSVHLARMPAGEWVGLDAITIPEPDGLGITDTALFDERGPLGRATQTLFVEARPGAAH
jgi:Thioesterase-like superfamily